ncbi:RsmF rRNA methyltransferase first C-terminal domain-containing protein [Aneurinibacillus thermoaerophilus]|uniref:NOL1/NOP2/sun family putative RNA methylase n=1 Tax=Aneurinibacillus thermoaerophilus TaxID=143495 RepID=A0A1G7Z5Z2_ANETH|nr:MULTISPECIES: RsmF rRNA methyltransferase first C-terminal domain-containing protein [Aneurinibacillus]AMA72340.1 SAM-dependent methyltransferase [Aneurinibacillus sp. XH2]MED0674806.1 RsmF rRNA methyltransferase first C-terminal domain-containing protein [Aneurinibacillus thermoaerophilus]MED0679756.1 RsmF rRNA methyltransferase first C-terminal domain-containing protein [Aneurinibacillus thermoaerophilus]MED0757996.1 RsmF rRNA methyltransferase first C-terminal domain-containing protein [A
MTALPERFVQRIKQMIGEQEAAAFLASYTGSAAHGLRLNPAKVPLDEFIVKMPFSLTPVSWCPLGFYYHEKDRPGKHPYHAAGLYYIQEPSAMAVVEALKPEPGDIVLDLCAAPGGKSTHISSYLGNSGLLVANEIHPTRVKVLSENLERWGARNILVVNETPERMAERFRGFFDKIVVDAPCSGEGMFRKLPEACDDWSEEKIGHCAFMQADILESASIMLKPGGVMVYSTCTFSEEENEWQIERFLLSHPEFSLEPVAQGECFFERGKLANTYRLWPHKLSGEGHFLARLRKSASTGERSEKPGAGKVKPIPAATRKLFEAFCRETLTFIPEGQYALFGEQLYLLADGLPSLKGLKIARAGWHMGTVKKDRFEPSHALALALKPGEWKRNVNFSTDSDEVYRYLKGESLFVQKTGKGWDVVTVDGYPLGWGKLVQGQLKNHYPKGLRWV